jgi:hypothetical protein
MRKLLSIAAIPATLVLLAGAAQAATIVTATWTGTLRGDGTNPDQADVFGGGTFAKDTPFKLVSTFSTDTGSYSSAGKSITGGGTAALTINGHTFPISTATSFYGIGPDHLQLRLGDAGTDPISLSADFDPLGGLPGSILTSFGADCFALSYCSGTFGIQEAAGFTGAGFDAAHLEIVVSQTPLPATLPLFASALLGLGYVTRRRHA